MNWKRLGIALGLCLLLSACGGGGGGGGPSGPSTGVWDSSTWDNALWSA